MAFLGQLHLLRAFHLFGELLQLFQQMLVGETECLYLIDVVMHGFQGALGRSAIHVILLVFSSLGDWRGSCLCSELIPSVTKRSALFVKELSFP